VGLILKYRYNVRIIKVKAMKGFTAIITTFVGLTIAIVLVTSVVLPQVFNANTSGWDAASVAMWGIVPIVIIAGVILYILR